MKIEKMKGKDDKLKKIPSLLSLIVIEVFYRYWLLTLLVIITVISSMQKAKTSHNARRAIAELQMLKDENQQLQIEWQSLNLEMTLISESTRVTQLATKELTMVTVNSSNEKVISL